MTAPAKRPYFVRVGNHARSKMHGVAGRIEAVDDAHATATLIDHDGNRSAAIRWTDLQPLEDATPAVETYRADALPALDWFDTSQSAAERVAKSEAHAKTMSAQMVTRLGATIVYQAGVIAAARAHLNDPAKARAAIDKVLPARRRMKGDDA